MNKPARSSTRRSTPTTTVTHKEPVKVETPSFTVIRDGRILKQDAVDADAATDAAGGK
jgi:hypothetical protein